MMVEAAEGHLHEKTEGDVQGSGGWRRQKRKSEDGGVLVVVVGDGNSSGGACDAWGGDGDGCMKASEGRE